jgi:hypothetical protein
MQRLLTYCNTRQYLTNRWKGDVFNNSFYLSEKELQKWNINRTKFEAIPQIITVGLNTYNIQGVNEINLSLVRPHGQPLTDLHKWMLERLCETEMPKGMDVTPYWKTFIKHRGTMPELFMTVDLFANRVHTAVSGMSRNLRPHLLLRNEKTVSLDLFQCQPSLLGAILKQAVGENSFSTNIDDGEDVYLLLQSNAKLASRDDAKKRFFEIIFGKVNPNLSQLIEPKCADWINWYKSTPEPRNPKGKKLYNNLAWILQTFEVSIMTEIWRALAEKAIPLLSIHDEIIICEKDTNKALDIMNEILKTKLTTFKITTK